MHLSAQSVALALIGAMAPMVVSTAGAQSKPGVSEMRTASAAPRTVRTPSMWVKATNRGTATTPEHLDSIVYVSQGQPTKDLTDVQFVRIFNAAGPGGAAIKQALTTHAPIYQIAFNTLDNTGATHVVLLYDAVVTGSKSLTPTLQVTAVRFRALLVDGKAPRKNTTDSWDAKR
jgi:hypothetical protein